MTDQGQRVGNDAPRFGDFLLRGLVDQSPVPTAAIDCQHRYVACNEAYRTQFARIYGHAVRVGMAVDELPDHLRDERDRMLAFWERALAGESFVVERPLGDVSRARMHYELRFTPLFNEEEKVVGAALTARDITPRRNAEREAADLRRTLEERVAEQAASLRASETRFQRLVDTAHDGVCTLDAMGAITYINRRATELLGFEAGELQGRPYRELLVTPEAGPDLLAICATEGSQSLTLHWRRKGEGTLWTRASLSAIRGDRGQFEGTLVMFSDLTELIRQQESLRDSRHRLLAALEASQTGTFRWNMRTDALELDSSLMRLLGLTDAQTPHDAAEFIARLHAEDRPAFQQALRRSAETGDDFDLAYRVVWPDGSIHWLHDKGLVLRDESGQSLSMIGACADITYQKSLEKLAEQTEILERIINHIPVMLVFFDPAGQAVLVNQHFERLMGWTSAEVRRLDLRGECGAEEQSCDMLRGFLDHASWQWRDLPVRTREGRLIEGSWTVVPLSDGSRIAIGIDMTDRKQLEKERESLLERVRAEQGLLRAKNEQLRALATQLTSAEQQERRRIAQTLHDHFQQMLVAAQLGVNRLRRRLGLPELAAMAERVEQLIGQSIEASRTLAVELCPPILYDRGLAASLEWLARQFRLQHGLRVHLHADPEAEPALEEVQAFLFQAVRELLLNVVKHSGKDEAEISMTNEQGMVLITVSDQGVGCEPNRLSLARPGAAGGFGLFSLQQRVSLLGGRVAVRTVPGGGCAVALAVPLNQPREAATDQPGEQTASSPAPAMSVDPAGGHSRRVRVMLVDDHQILREGLAELLREESGLEIVGQASDGQEAVELAEALRPDVIVMDISMPRMDGIEATRRITSRAPEVRVIGLSMHSTSDMEATMREAGATAYLSKGGSSERLIAAIRG